MLNQIQKMHNRELIINILFCLIPLAFIGGNLFINLNIVLLILTTSLFYHNELRSFKLNILDKIITVFFIYIFFTLGVNYFESLSEENSLNGEIIKKSFLYLRYYLLYIILRVLFLYKKINLNWFYISASFFVLFVCIDIIFQFFFLKNIFGNVAETTRRLSGVFGDELVAGGYIQRFSLFAIFLPIVLNVKKNIYKYLIVTFTFFLLVAGIILSGNKMPLVLFLLSIFLISYLFLTKKKFLIALVLIMVALTLFHKKNIHFQTNTQKFFTTTSALVEVFFNKSLSVDVASFKKRTPYVAEFYGAYITWEKNIILGGGLRSFRTNCPNCGTHPHNYYLEILADLGLVGFLIIGTFLLITFYRVYKIKNIFKLNSIFDLHASTFFFIIFIELFPIRSSGSFFSTNNAAFIFLSLAIVVSLVEKLQDRKLNKKT